MTEAPDEPIALSIIIPAFNEAALIGLTAFVIENAPGKRGILPAAKSVTDKDDGAA